MTNTISKSNTGTENKKSAEQVQHKIENQLTEKVN
jgi:hypothetical protein